MKEEWCISRNNAIQVPKYLYKVLVARVKVLEGINNLFARSHVEYWVMIELHRHESTDNSIDP